MKMREKGKFSNEINERVEENLEFLRNMMVWNTESSCDTISLKMEFCENTHRLVSIMRKISNGKAFRNEHYREDFDQMQWVVESEYCTIAAMVIGRMEWQWWKYYNRRRSGMHLKSIGLDSKKYLIDAMEKMSLVEKRKMLQVVCKNTVKVIKETEMKTFAQCKAGLKLLLEIMSFKRDDMKTNNYENWFCVPILDCAYIPQYARIKLISAELLQVECSKYLGGLLMFEQKEDVVDSKSKKQSMKNRNKKRKQKAAKLKMKQLQLEKELRKKMLKELVKKHMLRQKQKLAFIKSIVLDVVQKAMLSQKPKVKAKKKSRRIQIPRVPINTVVEVSPTFADTADDPDDDLCIPNQGLWWNSTSEFDQENAALHYTMDNNTHVPVNSYLHQDEAFTFMRSNNDYADWSLPRNPTGADWTFGGWTGYESHSKNLSAMPTLPQVEMNDPVDYVSSGGFSETSSMHLNYEHDMKNLLSPSQCEQEMELVEDENLSTHTLSSVQEQKIMCHPLQNSKLNQQAKRKPSSICGTTAKCVRGFPSPSQSAMSSPGFSVLSPKQANEKFPRKKQISFHERDRGCSGACQSMLEKESKIKMMEIKYREMENSIKSLSASLAMLQSAQSISKEAQTSDTSNTTFAANSESTFVADVAPNTATCYSESSTFVCVPSAMLPQCSKLHWDICEFVTRLQEETQRRLSTYMIAQRYCTTAVHALWPRAQVRPYGSIVTSLALPSSDLDLVICLPNVRRDTPAETPGDLEGRNAIKETWQQNLARKLSSEPWVDTKSLKTISHTPIPIITFLTIPLPCSTSDTPFQPVRLDISFEGPRHNGLATNALVSSLICEFPALRPLTLVLKSFLLCKGFGAAYTGGLSSYALLLLVVRFLQECTSPTLLPTSRIGTNPSIGTSGALADLGLLFVDFLQFYGHHLDPRVTGISVANRCFFNREGIVRLNTSELSSNAFDTPNLASPGSRRRRSRSPTFENEFYTIHEPSTSGQDIHKFDPIFIEDPLRLGNNVGRNCFRITSIRKAFLFAVDQLTRNEMVHFESNVFGNIHLSSSNLLSQLLTTRLKSSPPDCKNTIYRPSTRSLSFADVVMNHKE